MRGGWTQAIAIVALAVGPGALAEPGSGTTGADPELMRFEFHEPHMGTEFHLVLYSSDAAAASRASRAAFDRVEALNRALSDYDPESELMRLCARAGGPPVAVGADLFRVLERSLAVARDSDGAFDPTLGPVGRLWRRARRDRKRPDPALLAQALTRVGSRNIELDPAARTVRLLRPDMKLDLGGIAKGYAADEALKTLRSLGVNRALVAAAGDITAGDPPPGSDAWTVAVAPLRRPDQPNAESPRLRLANRSVSTSGDAEQSVEIDGVRYSHILDPRTGLGVVGRSSATVIAADGTTSDSLATALSVLGPERGLALIDATPGAAAYYVRVQPDGSLQVVTSTRWSELAQAEPAGDAAPADRPR